jgi:hypothetical protein
VSAIKPHWRGTRPEHESMRAGPTVGQAKPARRSHIADRPSGQLCERERRAE